MGKRLDLVVDIGKNLPTALFEAGCIASICGGTVTLVAGGVSYAFGNSELAKQLAAIGGTGIAGGGLGATLRSIPFLIDSLASPVDGYQSDLLAKRSLRIDNIIDAISDYRKNK